MTNTETETPSRHTYSRKGITVESHVNDHGFRDAGRGRTYKSAGGQKFDIKADHCGLFFIVMQGGGSAPRFCQEKFTSYKFAEKILVEYLRNGDKMEKALYPGSPKAERVEARKPKKDTNE